MGTSTMIAPTRTAKPLIFLSAGREARTPTALRPADFKYARACNGSHASRLRLRNHAGQPDGRVAGGGLRGPTSREEQGRNKGVDPGHASYRAGAGAARPAAGRPPRRPPST